MRIIRKTPQGLFKRQKEMKIKLTKSKKLKEMSIEEITADTKVHMFFTFATLGLGLFAVLISIIKLNDPNFSIGILGLTTALSTLHLLDVVINKFELRIREVLQEKKQ